MSKKKIKNYIGWLFASLLFFNVFLNVFSYAKSSISSLSSSRKTEEHKKKYGVLDKNSIHVKSLKPTIRLKNKKIAVLDGPQQSKHAQKVMQLFKKLLKNCSDCQIQLFPIYENNGKLSLSSFEKGINDAIAYDPSIYHFSWNLKLSPKTMPLLTILGQIPRNAIVVAAAGENEQDANRILKLKNTVMGAYSRAHIIGELNKKGFLSPRSNYGPEMTDKLQAPAGYLGSSFSAILYSSQLVRE